MESSSSTLSSPYTSSAAEALPVLSGFPWTDADQLTPILRAPQIWAAAFNRIARQAVKAAAKQTLISRRLEIHDDNAIGDTVVELLETRSGRKTLFRQFEHYAKAKGRQFLAERLRDTLKAKGRWRIESGLTVQRQIHRRFLDADRLAMSLFSHPRDAAAAGDLVISVAAFAILQPSEAERFADVLEFHGWGTRVTDTRNVPPPQTAASLSDDHSQPLAAPTSSHPSSLPVAGVHPPTRSIEVTDPRLAPLADAVAVHVIARQHVADLALANRYSEVTLAIEVVQQAESSMLKEARDVLASAGLPTTTLPPFPPGLPGDDTSRAWLDKITKLIERADNERTHHVRSRRDALIAELELHGIAVPGELRTVATHDELIALDARLEQRIEMERSWVELVASNSPAALAALPPQQRELILERLFQAPEAGDLALRCFAQYGSTIAAIDLERTMQEITNALLSDRELPPGLWHALTSVCKGKMLGLLDAHGISELIAASDDERPWQRIELLDVLAGTELVATHPLAPRVLAHRIRREPAAERVLALARGALATTTDTWVRVLIEAMHETGRIAEALLVEKAWSMHSSSSAPRGAALLAALVDATQYPQRFDVLRAVVSGPLDLVTDRESFLVYLTVAAYVEPSRVDALIAQQPRLFAEVAEAHPVLLHRWLLRFHRDGVPGEELAQEEVALAQARDAFKTWQHGMERKSSYGGWHFAQDYQARLNSRLRAWIDHLDQHGVLPPLQHPDELLDETARNFDLPPVEGGGRESMLSYLEQQLSRLHAFERVAELLPRRQLSRVLSGPRITLRASVDSEMKGARGLTVKLYERARKELRA